MISAKLEVNSLSHGQVKCLRKACKDACAVNAGTDPGAGGRRTQPSPEAIKKACESNCDTQSVFPCPHVLQPNVSDALEAEKKAAADAKAADTKVTSTAGSGSAAALTDAVKAQIDAQKKLADKTAATEQAKDSKEYCRPWEDYAIDDAIADLKQFHDACSFYYTLAASVQEIQKVSSDINKDLDTIFKTTAQDAAKGNKPATAGTDDKHTNTKTPPAAPPAPK